MTEPTHADILHRIELSEREIAILDVNVKNINDNVKEIKLELRENGQTAREALTIVRNLPKTIAIMVSILGVIFGVLSYFDGFLR